MITQNALMPYVAGALVDVTNTNQLAALANYGHQRTQEGIRLAGFALYHAKQQLGEYEFKPWLAEHTVINYRTALNYIRTHIFIEAHPNESEIISLMQPSIIYQIAAPKMHPHVQELVLSGDIPQDKETIQECNQVAYGLDKLDALDPAIRVFFTWSTWPINPDYHCEDGHMNDREILGYVLWLLAQDIQDEKRLNHALLLADVFAHGWVEMRFKAHKKAEAGIEPWVKYDYVMSEDQLKELLTYTKLGSRVCDVLHDLGARLPIYDDEGNTIGWE